MPVRKTRKTFVDYFSPAESAFTNWLARNGTTLLSRGAAAHRSGSRFADGATALAMSQRSPIEPIGEATEYVPSTEFSTIFDEFETGVLQNAGETLPPQSASLRQQATRLHSVSEVRRRAAPTLFMGGMEDDARPGGTASPPQPRQETRREPPREVHPPMRETSRPPECEQLRSHINSLNRSRAFYIRERERVLAASYAPHEKMRSLQSVLHQKRERLSALEYQLRVLDQIWPPSTPRMPRPGYPGPVPDIVDFAVRRELRRQVATLRREIQHIENHMNFLGHNMLQAGRYLAQIYDKRREVEIQILESERQYHHLKCGNLDPSQQEWR